jgi:hypothetical protein
MVEVDVAIAHRGPRDVADGRWSEGTLMVPIDVVVAHRGARDVRDGRMVASLLGGQSNARPIPAGRI